MSAAHRAVIDIGPELYALLIPLVTAFAAWIGTRSVRKEMQTNGGSSMRDAVNRIEKHQAEQTAQLDAASAQLTTAASTLATQSAQLDKLTDRVDTAGQRLDILARRVTDLEKPAQQHDVNLTVSPTPPTELPPPPA